MFTDLVEICDMGANFVRSGSVYLHLHGVFLIFVFILICTVWLVRKIFIDATTPFAHRLNTWH